MEINWKRSKPVDWECSNYEYEKLRTLNSLSYQLKILGDRLDAVDSTHTAEMLAEIVNTQARAILDVVDRNNGHYTGNYTTSNGGHYDGSTSYGNKY